MDKNTLFETNLIIPAQLTQEGHQFHIHKASGSQENDFIAGWYLCRYLG